LAASYRRPDVLDGRFFKAADQVMHGLYGGG
jgi:hypothetical protein